MKKLMITFNLCLCFYLFSFAQQMETRDYKYTVHFETDQDQLTSHAKSKLEKRLAEYVAKDVQSIQIVGHADARGTADYNIALSERRTQSVQDFLNQNGFNRFPISTHFKGENEPHIIDNSEIALQANRRVEIWFFINEFLPEIIYDYSPSLDCGNSPHLQNREEDIPVQPLVKIEKPLTAYQQFHQQMDKSNLNFYLENDRGGLIKAKEGTIIYFPKNSFCDCNTKENIDGEVNIQLKEYYQISDFIQAGLNTNSNGNMLQSAGTIHIDAFHKKEKVCLKERQEYQILFPKNKMNKKSYNDMNLFTGNLNDNGEVNWGVMRKDGLKNKKAIDFANNYGNDCSKCGGFKRDCSKQKFFERFRDFFTRHRSWKNYKFCRSPQGIASNRQYNQAVINARNTCNNKRDAIVSEFKISFEELVNEFKKEGKGWEDYLFNYYITTSTRLNYINCDRFTNYPKKQLRTVSIRLDSKKDFAVKIIIKSANGIMAGHQKNRGKYTFGKLPDGKKAELLAYDYSEEKPKVAKHSFRIGEEIKAEDLVFEEYSIQDLKKYISTLN